MNYYVTGNLEHDHKLYTRGEQIDFDESDARPLLRLGILQEQPIVDEAPAEPASEPEVQPEPEVAGKPLETGEPSIDGPKLEQRGEDKAEDVTPPGAADAEPDNGATQPREGEEAAGTAKEAQEEPEGADAPNPPSRGRRMRALSPDTKEENDPSAGL